MPIRVVTTGNKPIVLFYKASCQFSNFYPAEFFGEGARKFKFSEQYFMYQKAILASDQKSAENILKMEKPLLMKKAGRKLKMDQRMLEDWSKKSSGVMYKSCLLKFSQNEHLLLSLFRTTGMLLAEASARDKLWGIGLGINDKQAEDPKIWKGANKLGKVLEKVRDELWESPSPKFEKLRRIVENEDLEKKIKELRKIG